MYRNDEKKEDDQESELEDEPVKERKKSFPEIVDKVIKVINLGFGLGQDLNQVEEIEELDEVREGTAEGEMMEDAEQTKTKGWSLKFRNFVFGNNYLKSSPNSKSKVSFEICSF